MTADAGFDDRGDFPCLGEEKKKDVVEAVMRNFLLLQSEVLLTYRKVAET